MSRPQRPTLHLLSPSSPTSSPFPFSKVRSLFTPRVRFPSTPDMTTTHDVWSPGTYDRAPIHVSPNTCELPDRHDRVLYSPAPDSKPLKRGKSIRRSVRRKPRTEGEDGGYFGSLPCSPLPVDSPSSEYGQESPLSPPPLDPDSPSSDDGDEVTTPPDTACGDARRMGAPLSPDVYVTSHYNDGEELTRICAPPEPKKTPRLQRRPTGRRKMEDISGRFTEGFSAELVQLDEGCLGGF